MNTLTIASASAAALVAIAAFDATPAEARKGMSFSGARSFSAPRASSAGRSFSSKTFSAKSFSKPKMTLKTTPKMKLTTKSLAPKSLGTKLGKVNKIDKVGKLGKLGKIDKSVLSKGPGNLGKQHLFKPAKLNLATLPKHKGMLGKANLVGRMAVPKNIKPKLALGLAPKPHFKHAFAPFVQRHWKKSFFWVAVAGIGYLTVPELYYDRFHSCTYRDHPDYDECVRILSYAAVEEESVGRVRYTMPASATYRYKAKSEPTREARQTCSLEPFVERKWNREFVWVEIPETGNVTVPEDVYDQFQTKVDGTPPDYVAACNVLVQAAAADTVVATTAMDLGRKL
ncbi:MAG: hypothetical protein AB7O44_16280 [Hyphomicrobiaceae bacterium]